MEVTAEGEGQLQSWKKQAVYRPRSLQSTQGILMFSCLGIPYIPDFDTWSLSLPLPRSMVRKFDPRPLAFDRARQYSR